MSGYIQLKRVPEFSTQIHKIGTLGNSVFWLEWVWFNKFQSIYRLWLSKYNKIKQSINQVFFVLQGQYVLETYFIMILYGLISFGMILLLEAAENKGDIGKRRVFAVVGGVLFVFFFSLILSIFRSKAGGYPYSFLLR